MTEQNTKRQETYGDLSISTYSLLSTKKKNSDEAKHLLIEKGLDETTARRLISEIEYRIRAEQRKAKEDMKKGGLFFIIGVVITSVTYLLKDFSHLYILTWGFIIYGAFFLLKGFSNWNG